jgi:hypothetical protein
LTCTTGGRKRQENIHPVCPRVCPRSLGMKRTHPEETPRKTEELVAAWCKKYKLSPMCASLQVDERHSSFVYTWHLWRPVLASMSSRDKIAALQQYFDEMAPVGDFLDGARGNASRRCQNFLPSRRSTSRIADSCPKESPAWATMDRLGHPRDDGGSEPGRENQRSVCAHDSEFPLFMHLAILVIKFWS